MFSIKPVYDEKNYQVEEFLLETSNFKAFVAGPRGNQQICILVKRESHLEGVFSRYKYEINEKKENGDISFESSKPVEIIFDVDDQFKATIIHHKYSKIDSKEKRESKSYNLIIIQKKLVDELHELIAILRRRRGW